MHCEDDPIKKHDKGKTFSVCGQEQKKNASGVLTGLPEEMKTLGRSGRRWKDNIRTELCGLR
jgi:hypothetical protein